MKSIRICFVVTVLSVVYVLPLAVAQAPKEPDWMELYFSERNRQYHDMTMRTMLRAQWNGKNTRMSVQPLFENPEFRTALDLSEEQIQELDFMTNKNGSMGHWYQTKALVDPELKERLDEMAAIQKGDHHLENATKEQLDRYAELTEEITYYYFEESQNDLEKVLTPEQLRSVHEMEIALLPEMGMINPGMFDALNLSEEQRQKMEEIKQTMEKDFNALVEESVKVQNEIKDILYAFVKQENAKSHQDFQKAMRKASADEVTAEKIKTIRQSHEKKGREFITRLKTKMLDVLTDEQLDKMQKLIDNPPDYLKKLLASLRAQREAGKKAGQWSPGPDSWRPGDPIPPEYIKERKTRKFPVREPAKNEKTASPQSNP